jgi:hypothetical protein
MTTIPLMPAQGAVLTGALAPDTPHPAPPGAQADWSAVAAAHTRTVDAREGFAKMLDLAEPGFRPVVQRYLDLHTRHAGAFARILGDAGIPPDASGSFMALVNRAVIATRALFDQIDADLLAQIRSGEEHVARAYAEAQMADLPTPVRDEIAQMTHELEALIADTAPDR